MARQPIMDRKGKVSAYELLYRQGLSGGAGPLSEADQHRSILSAMVEVGLNRLAGDKPAFFNLSPSMLESVCTNLLPPGRVVLELLEDTVLNERTAKRMLELKSQGYRLAYDDFTFQPHQVPFANHVQLIKIDVMDTPWRIVEHGVPRLKRAGIHLLAEKVENRETYERCHRLGFDLFQGYYFAKPETLTSRGFETRQKAVLALLRTLNRSDATAAQLEESIAKDAMLAARLLKLVNSVGFGAARRIDSIRVAIQMLGISRLQAFATVLAASEATGSDNRALSEVGLIRARLCEKAARQLGRSDPHKYFTIGLLSVLDAMMGLPMKDIVGELALSPEIVTALLEPHRSEELRIVAAFERGGWAALDGYRLNEEEWTQTYAAAVADAAGLD